MRRGAKARIAVGGAAVAEVGSWWIARRRGRYRRVGEVLTAVERERFRGYFSEELMESVRVARVERIEPALPRWLVRGLRLPRGVELSHVAGMAFGDAVALVKGQEKRRGDAGKAGSLLFHELVHCAQYRAMGVRAFLREYLGGWACCGYDYMGIPLEVQAYAMQARFERGECFSVEAEVRGVRLRLRGGPLHSGRA